VQIYFALKACFSIFVALMIFWAGDWRDG